MESNLKVVGVGGVFIVWSGVRRVHGEISE